MKHEFLLLLKAFNLFPHWSPYISDSYWFSTVHSNSLQTSLSVMNTVINNAAHLVPDNIYI